MASIKRRWEILLDPELIYPFQDLLLAVDGTIYETNHHLGTKLWLMVDVSEEFRILAKLRFNIEELNAFGTEIKLTN